MDFNGKVVLVTGACSGIGEATAKEFSSRGAQLAMTGLSKKGPVPGLWITSDLSKAEEVERVFNETINKYGKLDVLVNCAGIVEEGDITETSLQQLKKVMDVNLNAAYYFTTLCSKALIETSGCIVNVSSVASIKPFSEFAAYCISKSAVDQLTKLSAMRLSPNGVRVNAVNPGAINTNILTVSLMSEEEKNQYLERIKESHALKRVGRPEEVARVICFLASDQASFVTGTCIPVDGGMAVL